MATGEYPSFLYKIDGFDKMAEEAAIAHSVVKKAFKLKLPSFLSSKTRRPFTLKEYIKDPHLHGTLKGDPVKMKEFVEGYKAVSKEFPKGSFRSTLTESIRDTPPTAILASALVTATPAAILAEKVIGNKMEKRRTDRSYREMLRIYPDLKREKQDDVKRYFDYVKMYSPTVAKNPHAAGSVIKRLISSGGMLMDHSVIEGLLNVEKTRTEVSRYSSKDTGSSRTISNIASQIGASVV